MSYYVEAHFSLDAAQVHHAKRVASLPDRGEQVLGLPVSVFEEKAGIMLVVEDVFSIDDLTRVYRYLAMAIGWNSGARPMLPWKATIIDADLMDLHVRNGGLQYLPLSYIAEVS